MKQLSFLLIFAATSVQAVPLGYPGYAPGQPDARPDFQPSGDVVWKVTIAKDADCREIVETHWSREQPIAPNFIFRDMKTGAEIHPKRGLWVCADWRDATHPDGGVVTLSDADRAAIRSNWPTLGKSSDGQDPPPRTGGKSEIFFWVIALVLAIFVTIAILKDKRGE